MMKINFISNIFGMSGYERHGRGLLNGLGDLGCEVSLDCFKPLQWEREANDFELSSGKREFMHDGNTVMISQPPYWPLGISHKAQKFAGFCVWEGDKIPSYWLNLLNDKRVDYVLVPSKHSKDAILGTIAAKGGFAQKCQDKIRIIPHGIDPTKIFPDGQKFMAEKEKIERPFTFIANKGWSQGINDRGGMQWIFKAYTNEFTKKDNVVLKAKINPVYNRPDWNIVDEMAKLELKRDGNNAPLMTTHELLADSALNQFYNEGDCFVSASMADAFNIPCLEAMGVGMPVITTAFGGQADFVNKNNGWLIDKGEYGLFSKELMYEDVKWFKPDIKALQEAMRYAYDNQDETKKKGAKALEDSRQWTWLESAKKLKKVLSED